MAHQWRGVITEYADRLPMLAGAPTVTLREGGTPLIPAEHLSELVGAQVHVKYEGLNPTGSFKDRGMTMAVTEAKAKRAKGQRIWCVPFARTASGVEIKGNAKTWWNQAKGQYQRGKQPVVGSVIAFAATRKMPMGHVAVVSEVVSEREIRIDHANWNRNQVSLKMAVIDVSSRGDWSAVRVESRPETFGSVYPVNGFIYPKAKG